MTNIIKIFLINVVLLKTIPYIYSLNQCYYMLVVQQMVTIRLFLLLYLFGVYNCVDKWFFIECLTQPGDVEIWFLYRKLNLTDNIQHLPKLKLKNHEEKKPLKFF